MEAETHDYASNAKGNTGVALGATALGLAVLAPHLINGAGRSQQYVTKDEFAMGQTLAAKDSEIALLKSENDTEKKMVEVYTELARQINGVKEIIAANKNEQYGVNLNQAVFNGTTTTTMGCLQGQIAQLQGLTKVVVPNSSVCPGWGDVKVTPLSAT